MPDTSKYDYNNPNQDDDLLGSNTPLNARIDLNNEGLLAAKQAVASGFMDESELKRVAREQFKKTMTPQAIDRIVNTAFGSSGTTPIQEDPSIMDYQPQEPMGISEAKPQLLDQLSQPKQEQVANISEEKQQALGGRALETDRKQQLEFIEKARFSVDGLTDVDFIRLGQNSGLSVPALRAMYFRNKLQDAQDKSNQASDDAIRSRARSAAEVFGDTTVGLLKSGLAISQAAVGTADFVGLAATGGNVSLAGSTGLDVKFSQTREILNGLRSDNLQYSEELARKEIARKELMRDDELAKRAVDGKNSVMDILTVGAKRSWDAVQAYLDNPVALTDTILESSLFFLAPAAVANGVRNNLLSKIPQAQRAAYTASAAGKTAIERASNLAALITIAGLEGSSNAMEIRAHVAQMDIEELQQSPVYQQMIKDGLSPEQAREAIANNAAITTFAVVSGMAAAASKVTGTDKLVGQLLAKTTGIKQSAGKIGVSALGETGEEYLQSFSGQFGQNLATQRQLNPEQKLLEGTFSAAGVGALSGGISAGLTTAGVEALQGSAKGLDAAAKKLGDATAEGKTIKQGRSLLTADGVNKEGLKEQVDAISNSRDSTAAMNLFSGFVSGLQSNTELLKDPNKLDEFYEASDTLFNLVLGTLVSKEETKIQLAAVLEHYGETDRTKITKEQMEAFFTDVQTNPSNHTKLIEDLGNIMSVLETNPEFNKLVQINEQLDAVFAGKTEQALNTENPTPEQAQQVLRAYGSNPSSFTQEQYRALTSKPVFKQASSEQKTAIHQAYKLRKAMDNVNESVVEGGENEYGKWKGINQYINQFSQASRSNNPVKLKAAKDAFDKWVVGQKAKLDYWSSFKNPSPKQAATREAIASEVALMEQANSFMNAAIAALGKPSKVAPKTQTPKSEPTNQVDDINVVDTQLILDLSSQWDRSNRTSRISEWMEGMALSNPAFHAVGVEGARVPAHGMAKVATLGQGVRDLINLLTNGIDENRTFYWDSLTNPNKNTGGATGTAGGHAYRDGPFIITFREGLNGQPKVTDITGVLVNPAHEELVAPLQKMFPNLTVRSYYDVADVVTASTTTTQSKPKESTPTEPKEKTDDSLSAESIALIDKALGENRITAAQAKNLKSSKLSDAAVKVNLQKMVKRNAKNNPETTTKTSGLTKKKEKTKPTFDKPKVDESVVVTEENFTEIVESLSRLQQNTKGNIAAPKAIELSNALMTYANTQKRLKNNPIIMELLELLLNPQGASKTDLFAWLTKHGDENHKYVLDIIKDKVDVKRITKVFFGGLTTDKKIGAGIYDPTTNSVEINPFAIIDNNDKDNTKYMLDVVLHEFIHAATYDVIAKDPKLAQRIADISEEILDFINSLPEKEKSKYDTLLYGALDKQEFIAVLFGDRTQLDLLNTIGLKNPTLFQIMIEAVLEIFKGFVTKEGIKTDILLKTLQLADDVFTEALTEAAAMPDFSNNNDLRPNTDNITETNDSIPYFEQSTDEDMLDNFFGDVDSNTEFTMPEDLAEALLAEQSQSNDNESFIGLKPKSESSFVADNGVVIETKKDGEVFKTTSFSDVFTATGSINNLFLGDDAFDLFDHLYDGATVTQNDVAIALLERLGLENTPDNLQAANSFIFVSSEVAISLGNTRFNESNYLVNPTVLLTERKEDDIVGEYLTIPVETRKMMGIAFAIELATNFQMQADQRTDDSLRKLLGLGKDAPITDRSLQKAGFSYVDVTESLANRLFKQLGLGLNKNITSDEYDLAVQGIVLAVLDAASTSSTNNEPILKRSKPKKSEESEKDITMFKLNKATESEPNLYDFSKLFANEHFLEQVSGEANLFKKPTLEQPTKKGIRSYIRSRNKFKKLARISKRVLHALTRHSQIPNKVFPDMAKAFTSMSEEAQSLIAGVVPQSQLNKLHINERNSLEAKNESTQKDVTRMRSWIDEVGDKAFYLLHAIVSNGRTMSESNYLDPQNSKFVRHMMGSVSSVVTVSINKKKDNKAFTEFKKAVLQAFDLKPDIKNTQELNKTFAALLASPEITALLDHVDQNGWVFNDSDSLALLENALYGTTSESFKADGATAGFHALVGLHSYRVADTTKKGKAKKFESTLRYEVDGKTNGVAHSLLAWFGATSLEEMTEMMAKVGVYTVGDVGSFAEFKKNGKDHYEYFAEKLSNALLGMINDSEASQQDKDFIIAVGEMIGKKDGEYAISRTLAKQPLMVLMYGAGIGGVTENFVNDLLQQMYNRIAEISNMENKEEAQRELDIVKEIISNFFEVNAKTHKKDSRFPRIVNDLSLDNAKDWFLGVQEEKVFINRVNSVFREVFTKGLEESYPTLVANRNLGLEAANASFKIFQRIWDKEYDAKVAEINKGLPENEQILFLNITQQNQLIKELEPVIPKIMGSDGNTMYAVKTKLGTHLESAISRKFVEAYYETMVEGELVKKRVDVEFINKDISFNTDYLAETGDGTNTVKFVFSDTNQKTKIFDLEYKKKTAFSDVELVTEIPDNNEILKQLGVSEKIIKDTPAARVKHLKRDGEITAQTNGKELILVNPGVSTAVTGIHDMDGSNQRYLMDQGYHFLNVHDAEYAPLGDSIDTGIKANEGFFKLHGPKEKNMLKKHLDMLARTIDDGIAAGVISDEEKSKLDVLFSVLDITATKAKEDSNEFLENVAVVNQFADIDSVYVVERKQGASKQQPLIDTLQPAVRTLGSSPKGINQFTAQETVNVDQTNIVRIYDNINTTNDPVAVSTTHQNHLDNLVKSVIAPVVSKLKLLIQDTNSETKGLFEVRNGDNTIRLQRGTTAPKYFGMSRKEVLAHEFVHAILEVPLNMASRYKNRMEELYDVAREYLTPDALLGKGPHSQAEKDAAQELYDYIFNNQQQSALDPYSNATGLMNRPRLVNNGMHEFLAFGLTNEKVKSALKDLFMNNPEARAKFERGAPFKRIKSKPNSSLFTRAVDLVNEIFNYFNYKIRVLFNHIDGLSGKDADQVMYSLAVKLTYLEGSMAAQEMKMNTMVGKANNMVRRAVVAAIQPVAKGFDKVKKMGASNLVTLADTASSGSVGSFLTYIYNKVEIDRDNIARNLTTELLGTTPQNAILRNLLLQSREYIDKARQFITSSVKTYVNRLFKTDITPEESASMVRVILDLDLVSLFNGNTQELNNLISDPKQRQKEIDRIEAELKTLSPKAHNYLINQSKALGFFLVNKSFNTKGNGLFNAHQIANLVGLGMKPDFNVDTVLPMVDALSSLYGLANSNQVDLERVGDVITREIAEGTVTDNAIQKYLDSHKDIKNEAMQRLFEGKDALYRKGYTREQLDPFVGYIVVSALEVAKYKNDGYRTEKIKKSKDDPNQTDMYIVWGETFALETYQRGAISTTTEQRKGTNLYQSYSQLDSDDPTNSAKANQDIIMLKRKRAVFTKAMNKPDYKETEASSLTPVYNNNGQIVDYRYEMNPALKRKVFNKKEMHDETLGHTAAATIDKVNTKGVNDKVVRAMHEIWSTEKGVNREFVKVGPSSKNKEDRDMWYLMPEQARRTAKALFGGDYVMVRKDDYRVVFGQRKANLTTLANWLDKKTQNTILEQTANALGSVLKHRYASIAWDSWVDFVALAKERIVILNTAVLGANIMSNTVLLFMSGIINPKKIISYQVEGYSLLKKYERDHVEMMQTAMALSDRTLSQDKIKSLTAKAKILEDRLASNPVAPLIDRGAYQTIIEDVNLLDDTYGYASKLERRFEKITNRIPDVVKDIGNTVFMTKATSTNQMLRDAASMSDFAARYALFKYNSEKGMKFEEAFNESMESFITYELPTNVHIQWMNDVGLAMFTKFYIRIQKVIFRRYRDNPLNMIGFHGIEWLTGNNISDITDVVLSPQNTLNRFYNPDDLIKEVVETNLLVLATK
jgi:hypothetical protein